MANRIIFAASFRGTADYEEAGDESTGPSARTLMRRLPEEEKEKIKEQVRSDIACTWHVCM